MEYVLVDSGVADVTRSVHLVLAESIVHLGGSLAGKLCSLSRSAKASSSFGVSVQRLRSVGLGAKPGVGCWGFMGPPAATCGCSSFIPPCASRLQRFPGLA